MIALSAPPLLLAFTFPGDPMPKARPRFTAFRKGPTCTSCGAPPVFKTRDGKVFTKTHPEPKADKRTDQVAELAAAYWRRPVLSEPVAIWAEVVHKRPGDRRRRKDPTGRMVKPDGDNAEGLVWDALKRAGVIDDDARVVIWGGRKRWAALGEGPKVEVRLWLAADLEVPEQGAMFGGR